MEQNAARPRKLTRSAKDRIIAGVAGGLAAYFEVDAILVRIVFLVLALSGAGIILYFLCWFFIPDENGESAETSENLHILHASENAPRTLGLILIGSGILFLLVNAGIIALSLIMHVWPVLLIVVGWQLLVRRR